MKYKITHCFLFLLLAGSINAQVNFDTNPKSATTTTNSTNKTGCLYGDCQDGFGKFQTNDSFYVGFFYDGKYHGYGMLKLPKFGTYIGNWSYGKLTGYGELFMNNNDNYIGIFKEGKLNGIGYSVVNDVWEQGLYKEGKLVKPYPLEKNNLTLGCTFGDCINGYGIYIWDNGDSFLGFFDDGKLQLGSYAYDNGDKYYGQFNKGNQFEGYGRYNYVGGQQYSGGYIGGEIHGRGYFIGLNEEEDIMGEWYMGELRKKMNPQQ